ncbi:452_t:CDS:1 [Gigaspora margarita]|uniref:452_t:CDS:1 n=1 Tax=Gigaspora margarita TaxID=4874 RepID=A0ABN7UTI2_GIGMA|nr:452_t:CDS:1 [Gigaspora margarita]
MDLIENQSELDKRLIQINNNQSELDKRLIQINNNLKNASENLKDACSTLRELSISPNYEFADIHKNVVKHSFVYKQIIFPFAKDVVSCVRSFMDTYLYITFQQFKADIEHIAGEAKEYKECVSFTVKLHTEIQVDFKKEEDNIKRIMIQKNKENTMVQNLAVTKCNWIDDLEKLQSIINNFVTALMSVTSFFSEIEYQLRALSSNVKAANVHFIKFQNYAQNIVDYCREYIKIADNSKCDLEVINFEIKSDYLVQWLEIKCINVLDLEKHSKQLEILLPVMNKT